MREWCGCGASIRASRRDVLAWRTSHRHEPQADDEPQKSGSSSHIENSYQGYDAEARIGFRPND